jgi:hypothetical protein
MLTLFSLLLAALAATGACLAIYRGSVGYQSKRYALLSARFDELEANLAALHGTVIGLRQRIAMREIRARKAELSDQDDKQTPDFDPRANLSDEEKTRQRLELSRKLAAGKVNPMRPSNAQR